MFVTCLSPGLIAVYIKKGYNSKEQCINKVIDEIDWMVSYDGSKDI
jgi:hypothetical protein